MGQSLMELQETWSELSLVQLFLWLLIFLASQGECAVADAAFGSPVGTDDMTGYVLEKAVFNLNTFCYASLGSRNVEDGFVAWFSEEGLDVLVAEMMRTVVDCEVFEVEIFEMATEHFFGFAKNLMMV